MTGQATADNLEGQAHRSHEDWSTYRSRLWRRSASCSTHRHSGRADQSWQDYEAACETVCLGGWRPQRQTTAFAIRDEGILQEMAPSFVLVCRDGDFGRELKHGVIE